MKKVDWKINCAIFLASAVGLAWCRAMYDDLGFAFFAAIAGYNFIRVYQKLH